MATQTLNPATEAPLSSYELMSDDEARATVQASYAAFQEWRTTDFAHRGQIVRRVAELLRERRTELAELMTAEMGKLPSQSKQEVDLCAAICEYTADNGPDQLADETREMPGGRAIITYQPMGVILGIQPWNFPLYQAIRYSIPNLLAGNGVLLKHADNVWGSALALEQLYRDAGFPPDLFRVLLIATDQINPIIEQPEVRGVTLTGSVRAGRAVGAKAGEQLKKSVLELGSNDAYLVLADADVDKAVAACVQGRIYNNGETCVAAKRFIVEDAVYDQFRDGFLEQMRGVSFGNPMEKRSDIGPIARDDLRDTLHQQVQESVDRGATVSLGGALPDGDGFFYPATVLEGVKPGMPAYDDELFGPVASLIRVADEKEALAVANDSDYGLGGGIFSRDEARAVELARTHFDTGMVVVNGYRLAQPNLPFGGTKNSGYGREHGEYGIREFVNVKSVMVVD